jgi:DNA-binding transcriptional MerR regulator
LSFSKKASIFRFLTFINNLFVILSIKYLYVSIKHNCEIMRNSTDENSPQIERERNEVIVELDNEAQLKREVIEKLLEPCDRKTYGKRLKEAAEKLGKSKRTVQRLVKKWQEEGLAGLIQTKRSDEGSHRINNELEQFIIKTYLAGLWEYEQGNRLK